MTDNGLWQAADGPAVEREVALDMVKRGLPFIPAVLLVAALFRGVDGAASAGYGIALVMVNFLGAAALLSVAARHSLALLAAAALGGYVIRLALITAAVLLVKDAAWVDMVSLGFTIIVTHLGLLFWEMRFVSASLAFPGVKPRT